MSEIIKLNNPNIQLERFYRASSEGGIPQSISDVANAGLSRIQGYEVSIARGLNPNIDALYNFMDLDLEFIEVSSSKSFKGIKKGKPYLIVLSGASAFSHDTENTRLFVDGEGTLDGSDNVGLRGLMFPCSQGQIDSFLGDKKVNISDEKGVYHERKMDLWTVDQFLEESNNNEFLVKNLVYGKKPFAVILSSEERENIPNGHSDINSKEITTHLINTIASGGKKPYTLLLEGAKERNYSNFGGWNIRLPENTGSVGFASLNNFGFFASSIYNYGASVGVAPEARGALVDAFNTIETKIDRSIILNPKALTNAQKKFYEQFNNSSMTQLKDEEYVKQVLENTIETYLRNA